MDEPVRIVEGCAFAKLCPERWAKMEPVLGNHSLRFCERCLRTVHACDDEATRIRHLALGRSIAVATRETDRTGTQAAARLHAVSRLAS